MNREFVQKREYMITNSTHPKPEPKNALPNTLNHKLNMFPSIIFLLQGEENPMVSIPNHDF